MTPVMTFSATPHSKLCDTRKIELFEKLTQRSLVGGGEIHVVEEEHADGQGKHGGDQEDEENVETVAVGELIVPKFQKVLKRNVKNGIFRFFSKKVFFAKCLKLGTSPP